MNYKKTLQKVCAVFVGVLLLLTFFSQSLYDLQIPSISIDTYRQVPIKREVSTTGTVELTDTQYLYAPINGVLTNLAPNGGLVKEDTELFSITSDLQDLREALERARYEQTRITLDTEKAHNDRVLEQQKLERMKTSNIDLPNPPESNLWEYDLQLATNGYEMEALEEEIAALTELFNQGVITQQTITEKEKDLFRLQKTEEEITAKRVIAAEVYEQAQSDYEKALAERYRTRDTQLQDQQNTINSLDYQLAAYTLEMEQVEKQIAKWVSQMADDGVTTVRAEREGVITAVMPGVMVGGLVSTGTPVLQIGVLNNQYMIETSFSPSMTFLEAGLMATITIGKTRIRGTATQVYPDNGKIVVVSSFESEDLKGGEYAYVTISEYGRPYKTVLPHSAIRQDASGNYVLWVEEEKRLFGYDYYARRERVTIFEQDERNTAINTELPSNTPIIINSDRPVYEDDRVRLVDGSDFFETR